MHCCDNYFGYVALILSGYLQFIGVTSQFIVNITSFGIVYDNISKIVGVNTDKIFQESFLKMNTSFSSMNVKLHPEDITYEVVLSQAVSHYSVFTSVVSAFHLLFVIPGNTFTLIVIAKTKSLWTSSNVVLSINGFFMIIGSAVMLVVRPGAFPWLLFDEHQRVIVYSIAWWAYTLTLRIGNNR